MDERAQELLRQRYMDAVDSFVDKIKSDPGIVAVIVCGSLAYDVIWEKSDIDMAVIVRDQRLDTSGYCLVEDGITINLEVIPRSGFKRGMERNIGGSFPLSYFSKGKIVYSTDDSFIEYFEDIKQIGPDDIALTMFYSSAELIGMADKCRKWLNVRKDPLYTQYYIVGAATKIAEMVLCLHGEPVSRQSLQKAAAYEPDLMAPFYQDALTRSLSEKELQERIDLIDGFLMKHLVIISKPVIEFMYDQQIKTITMISKRFHSDPHYLIEVFDYLADKGVIEKVSQTIRITPKGRQNIEEIGYLYIP